MTELKKEDLAADNYLADTENDLNGASVFISYAHEDKDFVTIIYSILNVDNRKVWLDWEDIPPSPSWLDEIHARIEVYDCFVFVLSPHSIRSELCNWQVDHAVKNGKRIICIVCEKVEYQNVRKEIASLTWIFFNTKNASEIKDSYGDGGGDAALKRFGQEYATPVKLLRKALDLDLRHPQYHTKILRRAIQWEKQDFEKSLLLHGDDLQRAQHWLSASALGKQPRPTTLHLSFITASEALDDSMKKRKLIAVFFAFIVAIGIIWPTWGVFFFSLVFSHFFVYFSSN